MFHLYDKNHSSHLEVELGGSTAGARTTERVAAFGALRTLPECVGAGRLCGLLADAPHKAKLRANKHLDYLLGGHHTGVITTHYLSSQIVAKS
jgi:hypothetical protein